MIIGRPKKKKEKKIDILYSFEEKNLVSFPVKYPKVFIDFSKVLTTLIVTSTWLTSLY